MHDLNKRYQIANNKSRTLSNHIKTTKRRYRNITFLIQISTPQHDRVSTMQSSRSAPHHTFPTQHPQLSDAQVKTPREREKQRRKREIGKYASRVQTSHRRRCVGVAMPETQNNERKAHLHASTHHHRQSQRRRHNPTHDDDVARQLWPLQVAVVAFSLRGNSLRIRRTERKNNTRNSRARVTHTETETAQTHTDPTTTLHAPP